MQKRRALLQLLPTKSKKRIEGGQPPRIGWSVEGTREVKLSTSVECPLIKIPTGPKKNFLTWLIDSGAAKNVIDEISFLENFPNKNLDAIPPDITFKSADGSPLQMIGKFITEFWFREKVKTDEVYVCKGVTKTRLLGSSLLSMFNSWGVDNARGVFRAEELEIPLISTAGKPPHICEVQLKHQVNIPGRSSCFVKAMLPNYYKPSEFVFYPNHNVFKKKSLAIPVSLVSSNIFDGSILLKVSNLNPETKTLGKGTKLGKVINNVEEFDLSQAAGEHIYPINSVQMLPIKDLEKALKTENPDLYKLFKESRSLLKEEEQTQLLRLLYKYRHVFSINDDDLGKTNIVKHKIVPTSNDVVYRRQYRHTEEQQKQIDEEVDRLLKNGVVKESMSAFNNPVLMVPKKEPGKWRFCLDCRYINNLTKDEYFPIPLIDEAMDSLSGATIFSILDMTSGYHQVPLDEETSSMCAFSTRKGHFQYTRLPMGLRNSGMTFQKMVTLLMSGMLYSEVLAYLDDCILYSKSIKQHFHTLEEVLKRFSNAGLKLKPRKCHILQEQIIYLGYLVDAQGIRPNPEATKRIRELKIPTNVTEVQRFLGKINYYRKFIPNLARIAHPLYTLTEQKSRKKFEWNKEHQESFNKLKEIVSSDKVMGHPRFDRDFIVDVDASDYALGAELSQLDNDGNERPIYFASRHLEKEERSYSATARETLAAVFGCEHFSHYLQGRKFVLRTDHNPLVWLRSMKNPKRPYSGWIIRLEQFNYSIQYRPGVKHTNADFNSRIEPSEEQLGKRSVGTQTKKQDISSRELNNIANLHERKEIEAHTCAINLGMESIEDPQDTINSCDKFNNDAHNCTINQNIEDEKDLDTNTKLLKENKNSKVHTFSTNLENLSKSVVSEENDIEKPSNGLLAKLQSEDEDVSPVIKRILDPTDHRNKLTTNGEKLWSMRENLVLRDGVLLRKHRFKAGLRPIEQIVLPVTLKRMALESLHDSEFAGHFGVKRTTARVRLRYYWPGYIKDIEDWCKSCLRCQQRKNPTNKNISPLMNIETGQGPFEHIALDILKLPRTTRGNNYLLVVEDYFTKWVEAFPMQRTIAPGVAQCLLNGWICRFGSPYTILSDQGSEFTSNLFKSLCIMIGSKKIRTTTYHPRTDGMVERKNRTLIDILSKYAEKEPEWDLRMPLVLFALRTSEHSTTGFSPFKLTYGQEAKFPLDILYGPAPSAPLPHEEWVAARKQEMSKIFEMVKEQTKRAQLHQKQYYDKNVKGQFIKFKVGEKIMYCDPASPMKEGKLHRPWSGPHTIEEKYSDALYKIKLINGNHLIVNAERLKKFTERSDEVSQPTTYMDESDSEDEVTEPTNENAQEQEEVQVDVDRNEAAGPDLQVREEHREPLMRDGGRYWCNVDPGNIVEGSRPRLQK